MTTRYGVHFICTISNAYITYHMNDYTYCLTYYVLCDVIGSTKCLNLVLGRRTHSHHLLDFFPALVNLEKNTRILMRLKCQNLSIAGWNCVQTSWLLTQPCHHVRHKGCFMCHWPDLQLVECDNKSKKIEESSLPHFEQTEFSGWEQNIMKERWGERSP